MRSVISPEYAELNRKLHADRPDYGVTAGKNAAKILEFIRHGAHKTVLDYGCGKGTLKAALTTLAPDITVLEYDPAIEGKETVPTGDIDMVVVFDVMEHVEPDCLSAVLRSIYEVRAKSVFMVIDMHPATKCLPDGRNAHLIVRPSKWWQARLTKFFRRTSSEEDGRSYTFLGAPLKVLT